MAESWMDFRGQVKSRCSAWARALWVAPLRLPDDPALTGHGFGPRMMSLCVNVTRRCGLRATEAVLQIVFEWLGLTERVPDWTTIRTWLQRLGGGGD